ncbi:MAG: hypothetical protein GEV03_23175 [Streptosporangiales bacterium]|nr:hypothetical protein [Streptosporangiales bacterium]
MIVAVGLLVAPSTASAAPAARSAPAAQSAPAAPLPTSPQDKLAKLEARAAKLSKQYRGGLVQLDEAKGGAKSATQRLEKLNRRLDKVRAQVARLAASQYMDGGLDPALTPLLADDGDAVLDKAVIAEHLARSTREQVTELEALKKRQETAHRLAQQRLDKVRDEVEELEKQRDKVERLMDKFRPQSPTSGDSITPRMQTVRDEIDRRFGPFVTIGCWRAGVGGEHPLGRACDFMLSTGGAMPSAENVELGWAIANWARANADRLGIMYIIYRQQIWDIRSGGGWEMMEDRGSITANHYDHPHISVF